MAPLRARGPPVSLSVPTPDGAACDPSLPSPSKGWPHPSYGDGASSPSVTAAPMLINHPPDASASGDGRDASPASPRPPGVVSRGPADVSLSSRAVRSSSDNISALEPKLPERHPAEPCLKAGPAIAIVRDSFRRSSCPEAVFAGETPPPAYSPGPRVTTAYDAEKPSTQQTFAVAFNDFVSTEALSSLPPGRDRLLYHRLLEPAEAKGAGQPQKICPRSWSRRALPLALVRRYAVYVFIGLGFWAIVSRPRDGSWIRRNDDPVLASEKPGAVSDRDHAIPTAYYEGVLDRVNKVLPAALRPTPTTPRVDWRGASVERYTVTKTFSRPESPPTAGRRPTVEDETRFAAALAQVARTAADKARKVTRILPLYGTSRRFHWGANFQPAVDDEHSRDALEDNTNGVRQTAIDAQALHRAGRQKYLAERDRWRSFEWSPAPVHQSMRDWETRLDDHELRVREAIRDMRWRGEGGTAIGLAAGTQDSTREADGADDAMYQDPEDVDGLVGKDDPERSPRRFAYVPIRGHPATIHRRRALDLASARDSILPALTELEGWSLASVGNTSAGSPAKWADLVREERAIGAGAPAQCTESTAASLREYTQRHRVASRGADANARFMTYICEDGMNCGGLGDRLLGMTSAFLFSLVTGRAFHAEWQTPVPIDVVFDSPNIDWSFSSFATEQHPVFSRQALISKARELDIIHFDAAETDLVFGTRDWDAPIDEKGLTEGMEARDLAFASPWIKFFTNRGMVNRAFSYEPLRDRLFELGLHAETAFSCILGYLFTPKPSARAFIDIYTSTFSLPSVFSVGIQIRTGDLSMKDPVYDRGNTVKVHNAFFKCADALADTYALPNQKVIYYLVTDSSHLREDARKRLGGKVVVSGLGITHIHQKSGHADGVLNAVIEEWMLAKTDYRVITQDSGFGKLASFAAAKENSTVTIFPARNLDVFELKGISNRVAVDCRQRSAFVSFKELASEWSLG